MECLHDVGVARLHTPRNGNKFMHVADFELVETCDETKRKEPSSSTMPEPSSTKREALSSTAWGLSRPLGMRGVEDADDEAIQLATLAKSRALLQQITARMPPTEAESAAGAKGGVRVHHEGGGHLSLTMVAHPHAVCEARFDVHMVDMWTCDIAIHCTGLGTGLLPLLALLHEPDLVAEYLPKQSGVPHIESLEMERRYALNDWAYHCFVSPWGPLPGADDVHALTLFDLLDEPERG